MAGAPEVVPDRLLGAAFRRGARGRCPSCGRGALYLRYLKVNVSCPSCGEALHHQRADDAPPYFTILIVGHAMVPMALLSEQIWEPSVALQLAVWMPATLLFALWLLPRVKGALIGYQWSRRMHGFGGHAE